MTLDQARQCRAFDIRVGERDDPEKITGIIIGITADYAIVRWNCAVELIMPVAFNDLVTADEEDMRCWPLSCSA